MRAFGLALVLAVGLFVPATAQASRADAAALQVAMRALGLYRSTIDGIAGPLTRTAVRTFQRRRSLQVDGIAGPRTRHALGRRGRPRLGSRLMRTGKRGWDIAALQFLLSSRGYGPGGFDGGFGPNTEAAVRRYQGAAGLAVDGIAGPATLRALRQRRTYSPGDPVRFLRPISSTIGDGFGWVSGRRHTGLDYPAAYGSRVGATGRGHVVFAGWNSGGYGNLVVVRHRLGFESWYAHLSSIAASPG
ncbi:MAG: peptidoglycan-binding protein, partial [Thermoleophilaceae bacterium]